MYQVYFPINVKMGLKGKPPFPSLYKNYKKKLIWNVHRALKYKIFVEKKVNEKSKENAHEFGIHIKYMK